jgi:hypothetical protein
MRFRSSSKTSPADVPMPGSQVFILQAEKHQVAFIRIEKIFPFEHSHAAQWEVPLKEARR